MDQGLHQCFTPQKYTCIQSRILLWILSNLPILPLTMGLLSLHLGLEQLKDKTIESSTMSQVLCSTIVLEFLLVFKIKLRDSIV
jgi:hypothetical protein